MDMAGGTTVSFDLDNTLTCNDGSPATSDEGSVKACSRWTDDNVNRWKVALTQIADLTGEVVSGYASRSIPD
ncbi:hypothetical protein E3N88_38639 [Mikania micrantha]|uniref:Uncharacterized protein n=1 Tax=Mikania micrantha TaxID=192012 RepID=A0A5N6LX36_9ASTR|nr:hypothetical protein E3N88_38639 [Mikania micrantha]